MSLLARLDHAIDHDELWVAYQPKLDCRSGAVLGAEALVRWTHPEKGQVYPDQFIGAAEQGGRIERLTEFVLDTAIADAAQINASGQRVQHRGQPVGGAAQQRQPGADGRGGCCASTSSSRRC